MRSLTLLHDLLQERHPFGCTAPVPVSSPVPSCVTSLPLKPRPPGGPPRCPSYLAR
jgi:hypothetical protein